MEVIYTLIPGMIFLGLIMLGVLIWAVKKGQYDDLDGDGQRLLMDEDEQMMPGKEHKDGAADQSRDVGTQPLQPSKPGTHTGDRRNWPDAE